MGSLHLVEGWVGDLGVGDLGGKGEGDLHFHHRIPRYNIWKFSCLCRYADAILCVNGYPYP